MSLSNPAIYVPNSQPALSNNCIINIRTVNNGIPIQSRDGNLYLIYDGGDKIDKSTDGGLTWENVFEGNNYGLGSLFTLNDGRHIAFSGSLTNHYRFSPDFSEMETFADPSGFATSMINPHVGMDINPNTGTIMFANYDGGDIHPHNRVWRSQDNGATWEIALDLSSEEIKHWHCCRLDPYTQDWWVFSGDAGDDIRVYKSTDDGSTWTLMGQNDRNLLAIGLVFTENKMIWGLDDPYGNTDVVSTPKDTWNPTVAISGVLKGAAYGNFRTVNELCVINTESETSTTDYGKGRVYITDGIDCKEIFSYKVDKDNISSITNRRGGFKRATPPDKYNRMYVANKKYVIGISLPFVI